MKRLLTLIFALFSVDLATAQNDTTLVIDGYETNMLHFATGTNNLLIVTNGGKFTLQSFAGGNNTRSNVGIITGEGSLLRGTPYLSLGGASNVLSIQDGGSLAGRLEVRGTNNLVTYRNTSSTNDLSILSRTNSLVVIDSKVTMPKLSQGAFNGLAEFLNSESTHTSVGIGGEAGAIRFSRGSRVNTGDLIVDGYHTVIEATGAGTLLHATNATLVGSWTPGLAGGSFVVSDGARADVQRNVVIGETWWQSNVRVIGADSILSVGRTMNVGGIGRLNQLHVLDGAMLVSSNATLFGHMSNSITLRGPGTLWTNRTGFEVRGHSSWINVEDGARLQTMIFTNLGSNNQIFIGPRAKFSVSGDFIAGDDLSVSGEGELRAGRLVWHQNFRAKRFNLAGGATLNATTNVLMNGDTNFLAITGGSKLTTPLLVLGDRRDNSLSKSNTIHVSGEGSALAVDSISVTSRFNSVQISDGAHFSSGSYSNGSAGFSTIEASGHGTVWNHAGDFTVGANGSNDVVRLSAGAVATNVTSTFGSARGGPNIFPAYYTSSKLLVEGQNTRWVTTSNMSVGVNVNGNSVAIRDGAKVSAGHLKIGLFALSAAQPSNPYVGSWNSFEVIGTDSRLDVGSEIVFGYGSDGNRFRVANGAIVTADSFSANGLVSTNANLKLANIVEIDGQGSLIQVARNFSNEGAGGIIITNGGRLIAGSNFKTGPRTQISVAVGPASSTPITAQTVNINSSALKIHVPENFTLAPGQSITLIAADEISGQFGNAQWGGRIIAANGRDSFQLLREPNAVKLVDFRATVDMGLSASLDNARIALTFDAGAATGVETSTDLVNWIKVEAPTITTENGKATWSAEVQTNDVARFFRLTR